MARGSARMMDSNRTRTKVQKRWRLRVAARAGDLTTTLGHSAHVCPPEGCYLGPAPPTADRGARSASAAPRETSLPRGGGGGGEGLDDEDAAAADDGARGWPPPPPHNEDDDDDAEPSVVGLVVVVVVVVSPTLVGGSTPFASPGMRNADDEDSSEVVNSLNDRRHILTVTLNRGRGTLTTTTTTTRSNLTRGSPQASVARTGGSWRASHLVVVVAASSGSNATCRGATGAGGDDGAGAAVAASSSAASAASAASASRTRAFHFRVRCRAAAATLLSAWRLRLATVLPTEVSRSSPTSTLASSSFLSASVGSRPASIAASSSLASCAAPGSPRRARFFGGCDAAVSSLASSPAAEGASSSSSSSSSSGCPPGPPAPSSSTLGVGSTRQVQVPARRSRVQRSSKVRSRSPRVSRVPPTTTKVLSRTRATAAPMRARGTTFWSPARVTGRQRRAARSRAKTSS
mmetsp:Transcript_15734/g.63360  ORF Transcript_15734/g.63360 Transcript_15734/m.63360 type:complete len:461 (-) Transcript_15734:144-1526(-)